MVKKVIEEYELEGKLIHIKSVNSGNINKTIVFTIICHKTHLN